MKKKLRRWRNISRLSVESGVCSILLHADVTQKGGQSVLNGVDGAKEERLTLDEKNEIYRAVADAQLQAWQKGSGYFYWSYKLLTDTVNENGWLGWDSWDLGRCVDFKWFPTQKKN